MHATASQPSHTSTRTPASAADMSYADMLITLTLVEAGLTRLRQQPLPVSLAGQIFDTLHEAPLKQLQRFMLMSSISVLPLSRLSPATQQALRLAGCLTAEHDEPRDDDRS
jgi:hypothetical protein